MKLTQAKNIAMLWIDDEQTQSTRLPFECQSLFTRVGKIHGQELLYREVALGPWLAIDAAEVKHLSKYELEFSKVVMNLASESLMAINDEAFVLASQVTSLTTLEQAQQNVYGGTIDGASPILAGSDLLINSEYSTFDGANSFMLG